MTTIQEAENIAIQRLLRAVNLDYLHIIHIGNGNHIIVSEAFYPQLSNEYTIFEKVKTIWKVDYVHS
jgi:hypothetical protein